MQRGGSIHPLAVAMTPGSYAPVDRGHVIGIYDSGGKLIGTVDVAEVVPQRSEPAYLRVFQPVNL